MTNNEPYKTKGIVLHSIKYGERGFIVYMLTEAFGRVNYWVGSSKGGKPTISNSKTSLSRITLMQFTVIEFVGKPSKKGDLHHFVEVSNNYFPENVIFDYTKGAITLFMAEVIYKLIRNSDSNPILFDFVNQSIYTLNEINSGVANFHIYFLLNLTRFLGYYPNENYEEDRFFDLTTGEFVVIRPTHNMYIEKKESRDLSKLQKISIDNLDSLKFNKMTRNTLVEAMIAYLNYHHETNVRIGSTEVLKEIF
ncbi:MAG: DNA repair protein RecO C-terminal domain-containing protein [Rikenellaceae bacterium]